VIVNPAAGRGNGRKIGSRIRDSFAGASIVETREPGEEAELARRAIERGATSLVSVGGDGTCSGIAGAIVTSGGDCGLAVVPCGTGNDFAKTLGVRAYSSDQIAALVSLGETKRIDVGLADGHYFLNNCGFGFDASVLEASKNVRWLKGDAVYIYSALAQLFTYRGTAVSVNGIRGLKSAQILMITVSNGRSLGGAFRIAPGASVTDEELDTCFFADSNVVERVRLFAAALRGTHLTLPPVTSARIRELVLTFEGRPGMEIDGELRHAKSARVELKCVPRALSVFAAPGAPV